MKKHLLFFLLFTNLIFAQNELTSTDKIAAWTKTWGFLKYFHPAVTHGTIDWDQIYVSQLDSLKKIETKAQLNAHFISLITDLNNKAELKWNSKDAMFIENIIADFDDRKLFTDELISSFENVAIKRISGKNRFFDYDNENGPPLFLEANNYIENNIPALEYRLLALARIWSVVEFFYPYKKERIYKDWNIVLKNQIPVFENATDSLTYFRAITSTIYELNDSHSGIINHTKKYHPYGNKVFPYSFTLIGGNLLISTKMQFPEESVDKNYDELQYNDIIQSIDGKSISEIVTEYGQYISGSNENSRNKLIALEMRRGWNATAEITVLRNNELQNLKIPRISREVSLNILNNRFSQPNNWSLIDNEIGFIQPREMTKKDFDKAFNKLQKTKALIIDLRYSINSDLKFDYFDDLFSIQKKQIFHYETVSKEIPGRFIENFNSSFTGKNQKQKYKGKVILLTNETIQSYTETLIAIFKSYPNVFLIGSPTSGTNGDTILMPLPGGYNFRMTSTKITYMDGTPSVGNGIQPDILVKPSINGLIENKDEILQKAIDYTKKL